MKRSQNIKKILKEITPEILLSVYRGVRRSFRSEDEKRRDSTIPPSSLVKQEYVKNFGARFGISVFVETGTYLGEMLEAVRGTFNKIYSIELSKELHEKAKARFAGEKHIELLLGDSGRLISELSVKVDKPGLFWLDAHYSGGVTAQGDIDTPIMAELETIMKRKYNDVIMIDDARCFIGKDHYPTLAQVREYVAKFKPEYQFSVKDDIIFIHI